MFVTCAIFYPGRRVGIGILANARQRRIQKRAQQRTDQDRLWLIVEHPLLASGAGAIAAIGIGAELAGAANLAALFYLAALALLIVVLVRADLFRVSPKKAWIILILTTGLLVVLWVAIRPTIPIEERANIQFQWADVIIDEYGEVKITAVVKNVGRTQALPSGMIICGFFIRQQGKFDLDEFFNTANLHEERKGMVFWFWSPVDPQQSLNVPCNGNVFRSRANLEEAAHQGWLAIVTIQAPIEDRFGKLYAESCGLYKAKMRNNQPYFEGPMMCSSHKSLVSR